MKIEIHTESLSIEQFEIIVNGQHFCLEKESALTEEEQKAETEHQYRESFARFQDLLGQLNDQGIDVSEQLAELASLVDSKGGDV